MQRILPVLIVFACVVRDGRAQAIVDPNQFIVAARFTNANPEIRALLDGSPAATWTVDARSSGREPSLAASAWDATPNRAGVIIELTADAAFTGVAYALSAHQTLRSSPATAGYHFAATAPYMLHPEPAADVDVEIAECAGLVRIEWLTGSVPREVSGVSLEASRSDPTWTTSTQAWGHPPDGLTSSDLVVRGDGQPFELRVTYTLGTDPYTDLMRIYWTLPLSVGCDEIVVVRHDTLMDTGADGAALGRIVGQVDLLGETEIPWSWTPSVFRFDRLTSVAAEGGPFGNYRWDALTEEPAHGAFELESLLPSDGVAPAMAYRCSAMIASGSGSSFQVLTTPGVDVAVRGGETLDMSDELVMTPATLESDVLLAGPPPSAGSTAMLAGMKQVTDPASDANADGVPEVVSLPARRTSLQLDGRGAGPSPWDIEAHGGGACSAVVASLGADGTARGASVTRLAAPGDRTSYWGPPTLRLFVAQEGTPGVPRSYVDMEASIAPRNDATMTFVPGQAQQLAMHACMSEVLLQCRSTNAPFFDPRLDARGRLTGPDFEGNVRDDSLRLQALGTPRAPGDAAPAGLIAFLAPEGDWDFDVEAQVLNPGGGWSQAQFDRVSARVGCRQRIVLDPHVGIDMDPIPPCLERGVLRVSGSARSDEPIVRVEVSLNGGTPSVACTACGMSVAWSVDLMAGDSDAEVLAVVTDAAGRQASVTGFARFAPELAAMADHPGDEPLRVTRASRDLVLSWQPAASLATNAYGGTIASIHEGVYDHRAMGACRIAGDRLVTELPAVNTYFLVGTSCGWGDSSLGHDSFGRERPGAVERCP